MTMYHQLKRRVNRWRFKRSVRRLQNTKFTVVANNCFGSRFYKILNRGYDTPFVGVFILPECFVKLAEDFDAYMDLEMQFIRESKYPQVNQIREKHGEDYPLGLLGDVEVNFLHYGSEEEALEKWNRRKARMKRDHLFFILIANGPCDEALMERFVGDDPEHRVCFHRNERISRPGCVYIPSEIEDMGNLYSQYHRFVGRFDFADWILGSGKR
jgi:uncharacterized protein (DUF1919 family)